MRCTNCIGVQASTCRGGKWCRVDQGSQGSFYAGGWEEGGGGKYNRGMVEVRG